MKKQIAIALIALTASLGFMAPAMANGSIHHNTVVFDNSTTNIDQSVDITNVNIDIDNSTTNTAVDLGDLDVADLAALDGILVVQGLKDVSQMATAYAKGVNVEATATNLGNVADITTNLGTTLVQGALNVDQTAFAGAMNCGSNCGSGTLSATATNGLNVGSLHVSPNTSAFVVQGSLHVGQYANADSVAAYNSTATALNAANVLTID